MEAENQKKVEKEREQERREHSQQMSQALETMSRLATVLERKL